MNSFSNMIATVFCVAGIFLLIADLSFVYMAWYSGVEMEWSSGKSFFGMTPWTVLYARMLILSAAIAMVLPNVILYWRTD